MAIYHNWWHFEPDGTMNYLDLCTKTSDCGSSPSMAIYHNWWHFEPDGTINHLGLTSDCDSNA